jgi:hypothetical protein
LNAAGGEEDFEGGVAAFDDVENVVQGGAVEAGDEADAAWEFGDGTFARGGEKAFGVEFLFEAFEGGLEFAGALKFEVDDAELILAARFINGHLALENDRLAFLEGAIDRRSGRRL